MSADAARASSALFDSQRLRLARLTRGMRKNELAEHCGVTPAAITQYELGRSRPRPAMVAKLSLVLGFPASFFTGDRPVPRVAQAPAFFRSLSRTRQMDRDRAEAQVALIWELIAALTEHVDMPEPDVPAHHISEIAVRADIEAAAAAVRAEWRLEAAVPSVVGLLELHGAPVVRLSSATHDVDAFSKWVEGRPIVVLWHGKDEARARFDAAHELGHLVMHPEPEPGSRVLENQAQAFASELLMPRELVMERLPRRCPRGSEWDELFALKRGVGVSAKALLYRSRTLGVMTESAHRRAMIAMAERDWLIREPHDLPAQPPQLLQEAVRLVSREAGVSVEQLAKEARLPLEFVQEAAGGTPDRLPLPPEAFGEVRRLPLAAAE